MSLTRSPLTSSKSRLVGASMVHCVIPPVLPVYSPVTPKRYISSPQSQDISRACRLKARPRRPHRTACQPARWTVVPGGSSRHDVPSCRPDLMAVAPGCTLFRHIKGDLTGVLDRAQARTKHPTVVTITRDAPEPIFWGTSRRDHGNAPLQGTEPRPPRITGHGGW